MKYRQIINLLWISIPMCVLLRVIQIMFTLDDNTGFLKQEYYKIGMLISFVVCAAAVAITAIAGNVTKLEKQEKEIDVAVAVTGFLTGGMFFYEISTMSATLGGGLIKNMIFILLALGSAYTFIAYGVKKICKYKFPSMLLIIPAVYYLAKLINLFVSTSGLALVTKNTFMLIANAALLLFVFEFASFENNYKGKEGNPKKLFAVGIGTIMICVSTALPVVISAILQNNELTVVSKGELASSVLMITQAIFIFAYLNGKFCKKSANEKPNAKHSA